MFLSFEGVEGAGKSTQIKRVEDDLKERGWEVVSLREPGGTALGEGLRRALLRPSAPLHPQAQAHAFVAARAQLLHEVTLKKLAQEKTAVLYDRYVDSTLVYQGLAGGLGLKAMEGLHLAPPLDLRPERTFYLRLPWELSLKRLEARGTPTDYFESQGEDFHKKLVEGYDQLAKRFPERIRVIDAQKGPDEVFQQIRDSLCELLD